MSIWNEYNIAIQNRMVSPFTGVALLQKTPLPDNSEVKAYVIYNYLKYFAHNA